jgi:hypothetical protein
MVELTGFSDAGNKKDDAKIHSGAAGRLVWSLWQLRMTAAVCRGDM